MCSSAQNKSFQQTERYFSLSFFSSLNILFGRVFEKRRLGTIETKKITFIVRHCENKGVI